MKRITTISLLIAAVFSSNAAHAEVVSYAWVGPVSFMLADLDVNDGITPSIQFYGSETSNGGQVYNIDNASNFSNIDGYSNYEPGVYAPYSGSASNALTSASSSNSGTDYSNTNVTAQGSAIGAPSLGSHYTASSSGRSYFTLSGNTAITFFADAQSYATSNAPYNPILGLVEEYSFGYAYIYAQFTDSTGLTQGAGDGLVSESYNYNFNPTTGEYENVSQNQSRQLSFTINNTLAEIVNGDLSQLAGVEGYSYSDYVPPSSVPVPAAAWLFGSTMFGFVGFKRRKA